MYIMSRFSLYFISDLLWSDKIKAEGSRVGGETWSVFIPGLCRPEKVHLENHKPSPFLQGQPSSQRYRSIIPPIHHRYILSSGPVNLTHCPPKAPQRDCVGRKTFLKPIIPLWLLKYLDTFQEFIAKQLWSKCPCKKKITVEFIVLAWFTFTNTFDPTPVLHAWLLLSSVQPAHHPCWEPP